MEKLFLLFNTNFQIREELPINKQNTAADVCHLAASLHYEVHTSNFPFYMTCSTGRLQQVPCNKPGGV